MYAHPLSLLELDGTILVVDTEGNHWVQFKFKPVQISSQKPHGLDYSITLHGPDGQRLAGFDNAHRVKGQKGDAQDHFHRLQTIKRYEFQNAAKLIEDFWNLVDSVLRERGVFQ